jgi:hypothetical protein
LKVDDGGFGQRAEDPVDRQCEVGRSTQGSLEAPDDITGSTCGDGGLSWVRHDNTSFCSIDS